MNNEIKRREFEKLHRRFTDKLMGFVARITTLKASLARLERQCDLVICGIETINAKLEELER